MSSQYEAVRLYLALLATPSAPKPFRDLARYYARCGLTAEADGFLELIRDRFGERGSNDGADGSDRVPE
jgi:hypothetical protein